MEVTGKNQDECIVALHDCNGDVNKAINILLEGDSDTVSTTPPHPTPQLQVIFSVSPWMEVVVEGLGHAMFWVFWETNPGPFIFEINTIGKFQQEQ